MPGLLGLHPILGRGFVAADELPGGPHVVVLGEHLWRSHFGADPAIVGRAITLTDMSYQVIGVFPSTASAIPPSPFFMARGKPADFWQPLQRDPNIARGLHQLDSIARLRSGVTLAQAAGRVDAIADTIKKDRSTTHGLRLRPLATVLVGDLAAPLALLLTAVALLLLIACGNVANLLLARSASRGREFAVRTALGADRGRLVSLVMVESVTRAAVGGLFGIGLAYAIVTLARTMLVGTIPRVATAAIDGRVLAVACGLSLVSGFLFGVTPALRASRRDVIAGLSGARGSVEHGSRDGVRRTLMVGEIALSFVLLVAAALLAESYLRLVNVPKGFNPDGLITARVCLPPSRYAAEAAQNAFFDGLTERLAGDFGPRAVTLASDLPIEGGTSGGVGLTNPRFPDGAADVEKRIVSSNYFDVLKAQLVRGRFFQPSDVRGNQPVVVVNETFARLWLEGDPIGQNVAFSWGIDGTQTVVGVVADVREGGLDEQPKAAIYISARATAPLRHARHRTDVACHERGDEPDSSVRCGSRCGAPSHRRQIGRRHRRGQRAPAATDRQRDWCVCRVGSRSGGDRSLRAHQLLRRPAAAGTRRPGRNRRAAARPDAARPRAKPARERHRYRLRRGGRAGRQPPALGAALRSRWTRSARVRRRRAADSRRGSAGERAADAARSARQSARRPAHRTMNGSWMPSSL